MATKTLKDWEVKKVCWENEVYVIQEPIARGYKKGGYPVKLTIDYKKQYRRGTDEYEQNSRELEDKINEVYRYLYDNNLSK